MERDDLLWRPLTRTAEGKRTLHLVCGGCRPRLPIDVLILVLGDEKILKGTKSDPLITLNPLKETRECG